MSNRVKKTAFKSSYVLSKCFFLLVQAHVGTPAGGSDGASHTSATKSASYWDITGVCAGAGLTPPPQGSSHQDHTETVQAAPFNFFLLFSSHGFSPASERPVDALLLPGSWQ